MDETRFWKLLALAALGLLALVVFRGEATTTKGPADLLITPAHANVASVDFDRANRARIVTTSPDGNVIYTWLLSTGGNPEYVGYAVAQ